jgi:dihydrofolate synthase/folylpolyglutamate synthase
MKTAYDKTLEWLFNQLPMYQRVGKTAYKADLKTTEALDDYFNHPHKVFRTIHVAGTNGKGSVSHMLASVLQEAGYKVGLYTSPHLRDFRERIKINGKPVAKRSVVDFVEKHHEIFTKLQASFFEMTVAMAFELFKQEQVEVAVVEVGMGGRLDSTNIIKPELSIITNISLDHTQFLGNSRELIAQEKAGIMKPDVPVVIGTDDVLLKEVFEQQAKRKGAPLFFAHEYLEVTWQHTEEGLQIFEPYVQEPHPLIPNEVALDLMGSYQQDNLRTVLAGLMQLHGFTLTQHDLLAGLKNVARSTGLLGRYQWLSMNPRMLCDTGHNEAGLKSVIAQLKRESYDTLHVVLGVVNDKLVEDILSMFPTEARYYFTQARIPRALPASELAQRAETVGLKGSSFDSVDEALIAAKKNAGGNDLIFIGGSTFVVAEVV